MKEFLINAAKKKKIKKAKSFKLITQYRLCMLS